MRSLSENHTVVCKAQRFPAQELFGPALEERTGFDHERSRDYAKDEWLTPPEIIKALGEFDLDRCAPLDDGLKKPWIGRLRCNPPYGGFTPKWMRRMADHGNGIALTFARTETKTFFPW